MKVQRVGVAIRGRRGEGRGGKRRREFNAWGIKCEVNGDVAAATFPTNYIAVQDSGCRYSRDLHSLLTGRPYVLLRPLVCRPQRGGCAGRGGGMGDEVVVVVVVVIGHGGWCRLLVLVIVIVVVMVTGGH